MADHTHIEWTDATWNPITGCSVVSPGCTNCYAMRLAGTRMKHHPSRAGLTTDSKGGPVWNGEVRLNQDWLTQPMTWQKPRRIFVCAHGDLFHEAVPDAWIDKVFAVMALAPQHQFQVLTKRSRRMRDYMTLSPLSKGYRDGRPVIRADSVNEVEVSDWPLRNVWLGVSAEDQARADERIPELMETPAAVRFVSIEPMLGPINLNRIDVGAWINSYRPQHVPSDFDPICKWPLLAPFEHMQSGYTSPGIDWVIVGGESGRGARPMHTNWARSIRDQCAAAGVAYFHKQNGEWIDADEWLRHRRVMAGPRRLVSPLNFEDAEILAGIGGYRFEHHSDGSTMIRVGKSHADRLLDGVEHNGFPHQL